MEDIYSKLKFNKILENSYGIRIHVGTKNQSDWCVEIPKEFCNKKYSDFKYDSNLTFYDITEREAVKIVKECMESIKELNR